MQNFEDIRTEIQKLQSVVSSDQAQEFVAKLQAIQTQVDMAESSSEMCNSLSDVSREVWELCNTFNFNGMTVELEDIVQNTPEKRRAFNRIDDTVTKSTKLAAGLSFEVPKHVVAYQSSNHHPRF